MTLLTTTLSLLCAAAAFAAPAERQKRGLAEVIRQCNHGFAYTWDDGPWIYNTDIVNKFSSRNGHTTFFVNGDNWSCIYDDANVQHLRYAFEHGMQIASHTWSHANLQSLSNDQIDYEIQRLDEAFVKILGVRPKFLRPPYGSINEEVANYIQQKHGKTIVLWDLDSGDSQGGNQQSSVDFYFNLAFNQPNTSPHLTLSHETSQPAANAALNGGTVDALANRGFPLLTAAQCTDLPAYDLIGGYGTRDSSWYCGGSWTPQPSPTPTCKSTYTSKAGDTCTSIENQFNLQAGTIKAQNAFLTCNDIWTGTPICVPDGPYKSPQSPQGAPGCTTQTYRNSAGETCSSIEAKFALSSGQVKQLNSFVTCTDIWAGTPLNICVPSLRSSDPQACTQTYTSKPNDTCESIAAAFGTTAQWIKAWNSFLTCTDIWTNTSVCVRH